MKRSMNGKTVLTLLALGVVSVNTASAMTQMNANDTIVLGDNVANETIIIPNAMW